MNYNKLLNQNEEIIKLSPDVLLDLKDYVNMVNKNLPHMIKWKYIKSYNITNYRTLWQLSENFLDSSFRPIGVLEPPVSLIEWIIKSQK
jgi:hypothetical protein